MHLFQSYKESTSTMIRFHSATFFGISVKDNIWLTHTKESRLKFRKISQRIKEKPQ